MYATISLVQMGFSTFKISLLIKLDPKTGHLKKEYMLILNFWVPISRVRCLRSLDHCLIAEKTGDYCTSDCISNMFTTICPVFECWCGKQTKMFILWFISMAPFENRTKKCLKNQMFGVQCSVVLLTLQSLPKIKN